MVRVGFLAYGPCYSMGVIFSATVLALASFSEARLSMRAVFRVPVPLER